MRCVNTNRHNGKKIQSLKAAIWCGGYGPNGELLGEPPIEAGLPGHVGPVHLRAHRDGGHSVGAGA